MKQTLITLLSLFAIGLVSCRRDKVEPDIKQYDQQQIQSYMAANGLAGAMKRDTSGGDTTGIYYQVMNAGSGPALDWPSVISYVYTIRTFDGKYTVADTMVNHFFGYVGHIVPSGLALAVHNVLKYKGAKARLLIPSHLAYGRNGVGSGSSSVANGRIAGNQCMDVTVEIINDQAAYDDMVIQSYMTSQGLTGYTKTADGAWYKVTTVGTGTDPITENSTINCTYNLRLLDNSEVDNGSITTATSFNISDLVPGVQECLEKVTKGAVISIIVPSRLGYGNISKSGIAGSVPVFGCLRFEFTITDLTP
ncbi:MAG: FKBP-type peptidyl-prolyl cis-trans isomerase [Bacteroidetes bacterium]|nr:FKBP-type peptidyl-prolyl cis-trans isomerase [Bacteroidota bacterium]